MTSCIIARNLFKRYKSKVAIDNISVEINENQLIGLIGSNGSGKTTFMKLCAGLIEKTEGELMVLGEEPMDNLSVLEEIVYSYHNMSYESNLCLGRIVECYNMMYPNFDLKFAENLLKHFNLKMKIKYKNLSQGMRSLFNFICGISCRAKVTMFDEPILGMDIKTRKSVYDIILRDYIEHPRTIIISSHILSDLENILSELVIINNGSLVLYEAMDTIKESAYRVDGNPDNLVNFIKDKKVLYKDFSNITSFAIIEGLITESLEIEISTNNLNISRIRPEELYIYLTEKNYNGGREEVWIKDN